MAEPLLIIKEEMESDVDDIQCNLKIGECIKEELDETEVKVKNIWSEATYLYDSNEVKEETKVLSQRILSIWDDKDPKNLEMEIVSQKKSCVWDDDFNDEMGSDINDIQCNLKKENCIKKVLDQTEVEVENLWSEATNLYGSNGLKKETKILSHRIPSVWDDGGPEEFEEEEMETVTQKKSHVWDNFSDDELPGITNNSKCLKECQFCYKLIAESSSLKHVLSVHNDVLKDYISLCKICKDNFINDDGNFTLCEMCSRKKHDKRVFECDVCGKKYRNKHSLPRHLQIHCDDISKPLKFKRNHIKFYECFICPAKYFDTHKLIRHIRKHTGHRPFSCHLCKKTFSTKSYLNAHMARHDEGKITRPYSCDLCRTSYMYQRTYRKHMRVKHNDLKLPTEEEKKAYRKEHRKIMMRKRIEKIKLDPQALEEKRLKAREYYYKRRKKQGLLYGLHGDEPAKNQ